MKCAKSLYRETMGLFYPSVCVACGAWDCVLCDGCWKILNAAAGREKFAGTELIYCAEYNAEAQRVIKAYKVANRTAIAPFLGRMLADQLAQYRPWVNYSLLTLPSTRRSWRQRGFHPVKLALKSVGIPSSNLLRYRRQPRDQSTLGSEDRLRNVAGSLYLPPIAPRRFLLVDDLITTGATLLEAKRAVTVAGGIFLGALALFRAKPRASLPLLQVEG